MFRSDSINETPIQEPPSFLVGCDEQNHWVAVEIHGHAGGLFADQEAALKFAHEETGWRKDAVRVVANVSPFLFPL
jgi:hypothetical protein